LDIKVINISRGGHRKFKPSTKEEMIEEKNGWRKNRQPPSISQLKRKKEKREFIYSTQH